MPWTHDIGPFYWHTLKSPGPPQRWRGPARTEEVEEPYRQGCGVAVRIGYRRILVVGKWRNVERTEDDALKAALGASDLIVDITDLKDWDGPQAEADDAGAGNEGSQADRSVGDARTAAAGGALPVPDWAQPG